ncbi:MAG: energy-coupling factor transporter ATPase [Spirochaetes bacterium]|nr:energy-coupling factor transporter ATPase [Spirochaetota bacterium]
MPLVRFRDVSFTYDGQENPAVDSLSFDIEEGEYLVIVGANGSGKSTLVRLLNGLRLPTGGSVAVRGLDTRNQESLGRIRSEVSLVFQSPADQIVSSVVEEDVAFGPENLGLPREEIAIRVTDALRAVGLEGERFRHPHFLSAGQQQRLAVAGALAMSPSLVAFDEATAMLDPRGRSTVLDLMDALSSRGVTIVHVTHDMDEAARASRAIVLDRGRVAFDGSPAELFARGELGQWGLALPESASCALAAGLVPVPGETPEALASRIAGKIVGAGASGAAEPDRVRIALPVSDPAFVLSGVFFSYLRGTVNERKALSGVSLSIPAGSVVALVGETGSGKSTILQLLNALASPSLGTVRSFGLDTAARGTDLRALRMRAPFSVQRPESALFEFYAGDDVAFGPRNMGLRGAVLVAAAKRAMDEFGLPWDRYRDRRSASLSGGEKRKLALAGVFAMDPDALLLDEPTSSLDPVTKRTVFASILAFAKKGRTVVFATHSMEEAARADLVGVVWNGELVAVAPPEGIFYGLYDQAWGIGRPFACELRSALSDAGLRSEDRPLDAGGVGAALARAGRGAAT